MACKWNKYPKRIVYQSISEASEWDAGIDSVTTDPFSFFEDRGISPFSILFKWSRFISIKCENYRFPDSLLLSIENIQFEMLAWSITHYASGFREQCRKSAIVLLCDLPKSIFIIFFVSLSFSELAIAPNRLFLVHWNRGTAMTRYIHQRCYLIRLQKYGLSSALSKFYKRVCTCGMT